MLISLAAALTRAGEGAKNGAALSFSHYRISHKILKSSDREIYREFQQKDQVLLVMPHTFCMDQDGEKEMGRGDKSNPTHKFR